MTNILAKIRFTGPKRRASMARAASLDSDNVSGADAHANAEGFGVLEVRREGCARRVS